MLIYPKSLIIPENELRRRINYFQNLLKKKEIEIAVILQNADLFYFTGIIADSILVITQDKAVLFVKKEYDFIKRVSNFPNIIPIHRNKDILSYFKFEKKHIGLELDVLTVQNFNYFKKLLAPIKISDISGLIRETRMVKSPIEVKYIKKAANQLKKVVPYLLNFIKPNISELDIFIEAQYFLLKNKHQGYVRMRGLNQEMYFGHILSKKNFSLNTYLDSPTGGLGLFPSFPQGSSPNVKIENNSIVSVDLVGCYNGYLADQTRPIAVGKPPKKLLDAFKILLEIQFEITNMIRPGTEWEKPYYKAFEIVKKYKLLDNFMGLNSKAKFIGHGLGIEINEYPFIAPGFKKLFEENMTFALEPKLFFKRYGIIGLENTFLIKENNCIKITTLKDKIFTND